MTGAVTESLLNKYGGKNIGEAVALFLDRRLGETRHASIPVDIHAIAEDCGYAVRNVSGLPAAGLISELEILVNADDNPMRQRFTTAHEIMHFLLIAVTGTLPSNVELDDQEVERICDLGASHILVPHRSFEQKFENRQPSLSLAKAISNEFHISLMAALVTMVHRQKASFLVVVWELTTEESLRAVWVSRSFSFTPAIWLSPGFELSRNKKVSRWAAGYQGEKPSNVLMLNLPEGKIRFGAHHMLYGNSPVQRVVSILTPSSF